VNDPAPTLNPFILDCSVLKATAHADPDILGFMAMLDARGQPLVIPALAITGASLDVHNEEADASACPIVTLDTAKWQQPAAALDQPLQIIEIADPGD
jgi:hypothetical protein